jgi:hypothetical protein
MRDIDMLAHELAYEASAREIERDCIDVSEEAKAAGWYDTQFQGAFYFECPHMEYLEQRGLIERDPDHPTWVAIREESEATQ